MIVLFKEDLKVLEIQEIINKAVNVKIGFKGKCKCKVRAERAGKCKQFTKEEILHYGQRNCK
jgi:hypothetical protein